MSDQGGAVALNQGGGGTGQGGFSGQSNQGYAQPAPASQRARVGEFSAFSAQGMPQSAPQLSQTPGADGLPGQSISLQNAQVIDRPQDPNDPFSPLDNGLDAQSQALALSDGPDPLAPIAPEEEQPLQAQTINAEEIRAWLNQRQQWIESDDLPDDFMGKFVAPVINGQRRRIPVAEAIKGYQRNEDYSNKLREMYAYEQQLMQREAGLQKLLTDMDDGQKFLDAMVFLKKFDGFSKAAIIWGTQLDAERRMTPEQRAVHQQMRAERARNQQLELELRALRAQQMQQQQPQQNQQQGPSHEQVQEIYLQQLKYIGPKAAAKVGFVNTPATQREFELHFNARLPTIAGRDLTSEFVEDCMVAAMESVEAVLQQSGYVRSQDVQPPAAATQPRVPAGVPQGGQWAAQQRQLAAQRRQELPPVSTGTGPTQPITNANRPQRARIGEFDRGVRGRL
jgi:hypothetical protein